MTNLLSYKVIVSYITFFGCHLRIVGLTPAKLAIFPTFLSAKFRIFTSPKLYL